MDKAQVISLGAALVLPPLAIIAGVLVWQRLSPQTRQDLPLRLARSRWRPLVVGVVVLVFMGSVTYLAGGRGSVLRAAVGAVPMAMMFSAISVFSQRRQRRGTTVRCAACEYDLTGAEKGSPLETGTHDAKCPECGAFWGLPGGTATGERVWSRRALVVAVLLLMPLLFSFVIPFTAGYSAIDKAIARVMPTGSLIQQIASTRGSRMTEWAELRTRTLTTEQRETLARGILTRDALQLHAWGDEAKWIVAEFVGGRLSLASQQLILRRLVDLGLFPKESDGTMAIRPTAEQAWGLQGCFTGYTILAVRGPVLDATNQEIAPSSPQEIEISLAALGDPAKGAIEATSPRKVLYSQFGTVPSGGRLAVWIIAEPRIRTPQPVVWKDGVPVAASDAIVVRFDLKPPTK